MTIVGYFGGNVRAIDDALTNYRRPGSRTRPTGDVSSNGVDDGDYGGSEILCNEDEYYNAPEIEVRMKLIFDSGPDGIII